jgi:hypothetical protein
MRIIERGFLDRIRVSNLFRRAPWNMEAAYNIPSLGRTFFMRGSYYLNTHTHTHTLSLSLSL